jgi:pseudomonalisin
MTQAHHFASRTLTATAYAILVIFLLALLSNRGFSQGSDAKKPEVVEPAEPDRVVEGIDPLKKVALTSHLPLWASRERDLGSVSPDLKLDHLTVLLSRPPQREQAFRELLEAQQNPMSAHFHQWLTPDQIGREFGASDHDLAAVSAWLESKGLRIQGISKSRTIVTFSGTTSAVGAALSTAFHIFAAGSGQISNAKETRKLVSIVSEPEIPAALAPVIKSFSGLSEIPVRPHVLSGVASQSELPGFTNCNSRGECAHFVSPADFATIFDVNPLYKTGFSGNGQRIGIIGRSRVANSDIEQFEQATGIDNQDPNVLIPPDGTDPGVTNNGDQLEATIDVTRAVGTAPEAGIDLIVSADSVTASGIYIASQYEVDTVLDPVANISFGACEADAGVAGVQLWDSLASQAAAEGISIFVSSGDAGAAGCDENNATPPATQTLSPNYICSSSYLTCVGGTEFNDTADPGQYWSSTNGSFLLSALSYIPEGGWNEPTTTNSSGAVVYQASSSGGGVSSVIIKPVWQTGVGIPSDGFRDTPDVAFPSAAHDAYFACYAANGGDCSKGYFEYFFGTSTAAPSMAGVTAILNQVVGYSQGNLNPALYRLAADPSMNIFHDTTIATSGVTTCSLATPSMCNNSTPSPTALTGGLEGYQLQTGYDQVTGLGSVDVANLVDAIAASPLAAATVLLAVDASALTTGQTFTATVQVNGSGPVPTGRVELLSSEGAPLATMTLTNGAAVFTGQSITIPGVYVLSAKYLGDATYQGTYSNSLGLVVTAAPSSLVPTMTLTASSANITTAQSLTLTAAVAGGGPVPTGTVQFSFSGIGNANTGNLSSPVQLVNGVATTSGQFFLAPGNYQVGSQYSGDANYQGAYSFGVLIAVTALPETFTLTAPPLTIAPGATTGNSTVITVTPQNNFTGTINFTCSVSPQGGGVFFDTPTCALTSSSLSLNSSQPSATLTAVFTTTAPSGAGNVAAHHRPAPPQSRSTWQSIGEGAILTGLLLIPAGFRRKFVFDKWISLGIILLSTALWIGCGGGGPGGSSSNPTNPGTSPGAYTVTIGGTSGTTTVSTTFTLTVK